MKKIIVSSFLALCLIFSAGMSFAGVNPLKQLTGKVWMSSTDDNKEALIYGVECAVSMEYAMAEHFAKKANKPTDQATILASLTLFPRNWIEAFEKNTRDQIVNDIDAWYKNNGDKLSTPVFEVLWKYVMQPKLQTR